MISTIPNQSPFKNSTPANTILDNLTCLMEELRKHEQILDEKIDEKDLNTQDIEDGVNKQIQFEYDKIFDSLFSRASYYDDFVQSEIGSNKRQDKQFIQRAKKSLIQNDSQRRIIQMLQYFQEIRKNFQSHKQRLEQAVQLYQDNIGEEQDIEYQITQKQTQIRQLTDIYRNYQKTLQQTNRSLEIECKQLERQVSNQMIEENKVRIKYQLSKLILEDNQFMGTLEEIQKLQEEEQYDQPAELVGMYDEVMSSITKLKDEFNIQLQEKNINDYLSLLKSKNDQLEQDSKKVQDLLNSVQQYSQYSPIQQQSQFVNSQESESEQLQLQYIFEIHNDQFYKQKQLRIIQEQSNYFENTIKRFIGYLDQVKNEDDLSNDISEAIQNNVNKKESINRINLDITHLQTILQNSLEPNEQSQQREKAEKEHEIQQYAQTFSQLRKLLKQKQQRINELQTRVNDKKKKRQAKKQKRSEEKRIQEASKNKTSEVLKNKIMELSKSKITDQSKNYSRSKLLSNIRQLQLSDKSQSPKKSEKRVSNPKKRYNRRRRR